MSILDDIETTFNNGNLLVIQYKLFDSLYVAGKITYNITKDNTNFLKQVYKDCIVAYCTNWLKGMRWSTLFGIIQHDIDILEKAGLITKETPFKHDINDMYIIFNNIVFDNCIEYISNKFDEEYGK